MRNERDFQLRSVFYHQFFEDKGYWVSRGMLKLTFLDCCSVAESCRTLCDSMDCNMPGSSVLHHLPTAAAAAAKSLQSCLILCGPIDGSLPGSPVPGILQARILQWVAISFSNAWKWKVKVKSLSRVRLLATPWTAAHQAPLSMDFPGKSTGVGCHCLLC